MTRNQKVTALIAALAALGALIGGIAAFSPGGETPMTNVTGSGTEGGTGNGCVASGAESNCNYSPVPQTAETPSDEQVAKDLFRTVDPQGPGPWPFVVLFDDLTGLKVRTTPVRIGQDIGLALPRAILWVDCQRVTDFDPSPTTGAQSRWYRVRWPKGITGVQAGNSSVDSDGQGWAYSGYLRPNGHNGNVSSC